MKRMKESKIINSATWQAFQGREPQCRFSLANDSLEWSHLEIWDFWNKEIMFQIFQWENHARYPFSANGTS